MSAGFFFSDDLMHWDWHENRSLDMYNYAPDVRQIGDYVYFCASDKGKACTIWRSSDPLSDRWEKVSMEKAEYSSQPCHFKRKTRTGRILQHP